MTKVHNLWIWQGIFSKRVRGKKGRGAMGKTPVFGILKRDGKVFVQIVDNCSKDKFCLSSYYLS